MPWFEPTRITERAVFNVLVTGFTLVLALLGIAGYVAVQGTREIERDVAEVGRQQLAMARLLNDVQAGQNTLAAILHRLAPGQENADRAKLIQELERADNALAGLAESAASTPEADKWRELEREVRGFSSGVRRAISGPAPRSASELVPLFELHDRVVRIEQQLLISSESRMEETERAIEAESRNLADNSRLLLGACLVLAALCAILTVIFARSSIRRIESQASELSRVSWHMLQDQESMARRFSHELHDELGQSLAAVKANISLGRPADWAARREDCLQLVDQSIANVRDLSQLLHPVILDDFGLDAGLRWLTEGFSQRTGIATQYTSEFKERLGEAVETHLFRIAQEALTNVARHSGATILRVQLSGHEVKVEMSIQDNGRGLREQPTRQASLGMIGMRARAKEIGADLRFDAPPGGGLCITVSTPLEPRREAKNEQQQPQQKANPVG